MTDKSHSLPKCQFNAAGDGVAAAAGERPYFILRKQLQKLPVGGEVGWRIGRMRTFFPLKKGEAEYWVWGEKINKFIEK